MFIIILLLCVCIFWMILWYYNRYIHYLECLSGLFVTCIVIFILIPLIGFFNSTDNSTHSTRYMKTTFYPYWVEEYTYQVCSGDEDNRTCNTYTDYIKHEQHWSAHDGFGTEYNISKAQFNEIRYKFGNKQIVKKPHKPGFYKGDKHIYVYNNETNTYEYPIVTTRVWQNYRKGSKNSLFSKTKHTTMKYPAPNPPTNSNRLHVQGIDITRKQWDIFNTKVYEKLPVNIIALQVQNIDTCSKLETDWMDGKYNDIILCFTGTSNNIENVYTIGWENELNKQRIDTYLLDNGLTKDSLDGLFKLLVRWVLPDTDKYKYLMVLEIPLIGKILIVILVLILQIFLYKAFRYNYFNQGDKIELP